MNLFLPPFLHNHGFTIYLVSAGVYLLHFLLAWYVWPAKQDSRRYPDVNILTGSSMAWKLTGDGYHRLTNGLVLMHIGLAFVPLLNTVMVYFEIVLTLFFSLYNTYLRIMKGPVGRWLRKESVPVTNPYQERIDPHL